MNNTLLIVGNGFDLNLGLKTSYTDFLGSNEVRAYMSNALEKPLMKYLLQIKHRQRWVDVETELGNYCTEVLYKRTDLQEWVVRDFETEYKQLCNLLCSYLEAESNKAIRVPADKAAIGLLKDIQENTGEPVEVVTFNYTKTIERLIEYAFSGIKANVFHVHGSIGDGIVFGVEDIVPLRKEHQFLYKSHSTHKDAHGFSNRLYNADTVVFFGYSLGETDHSYFKDFFVELTHRRETPMNLVFYYFNEEARSNLIWELRQLKDGRYTQLEMYNNIKFLRCDYYQSMYK